MLAEPTILETLDLLEKEAVEGEEEEVEAEAEEKEEAKSKPPIQKILNGV